MRNVACNVCGADDYTVLFEKGRRPGMVHQIVRCNHCSLLYANPQELVDCDEFEKDDWPEDDIIRLVGEQYCQKQYIQLPDNLRALEALNQLLPQRGRLLEIGSCLGIFLDRIRAAGWEATGLEPNLPAAKYSREKFKVNVVNGLLGHPAMEPGSFDAVVMLHVIEHMPDPGEAVREIRRLLRKGGVLVIETPRFDSLMFKILGPRERSMNNCPGHIYFFTVPTLTRLVGRAGFEVARTDLVGRTLAGDRFLYNVGLLTQLNSVQKGLQWIGRRLHLDRLHFHVNVRDMQRLYCRAI